MNRRRIYTLAALALTLAAVVPAVALGGGPLAASTHTVILKGNRFRPSTLSIRKGDSVTWKWEDGETEHNVTFHGFHSRLQDHGSYTVRFTRAGTFSYRCTLHEAEGMRGKILVH